MKRTFENGCLRSWAMGVIVLFAIILTVPSRLSTDVLNSSSSDKVVCPTTLKVVLVQFNDVKAHQYWDGSDWQPYDNRYKMSDFKDLLTSLGTYSGQRGTDQEQVFGSYRDYFYENSRQNYSPTVNILNDTDLDGYPVWIEVSGNKTSYSKFGFISAANDAATAAGLDISDVSAGGAVRLCYIYAGNIDPDIEVFANDLHGHTMVVPERMDKTNKQEYPEVLMTHMGYYAHEFGHLMGAHHTITSHHYSLMHSGYKAGTRHANRPASMNPWFLYKSGWANLNFIEENLTDVDLVYNTSPTTLSTYYIRKIPGTSECLLVENRQYDNLYDQSLPGAVVGWSGGILTWNILNDGLNLGETDLIEADDDAFEEQLNMAHDMFRPDVYTDGLISDVSSPANLNLRDGSFSKFAVKDFFTTDNPITVDLIIDFVDPPKNLEIPNAGNNGENPVLEWDASGEVNLQHYAVYKGYQDSKSDPVVWNSSPTATTTNTTWTDQFTTIDTDATSSVHYRVTAVDDADNESDYSNSASVNSNDVPKPSADRTQITATLPKTMRLHANYPNPFNPHTLIRFDLPEAGDVTLKVFNLLGEEVRTLVSGHTAAGFHTVAWDGTNQGGGQVPSGIYLYRLDVTSATTGETRSTRTHTMTLLR